MCRLGIFVRSSVFCVASVTKEGGRVQAPHLSEVSQPEACMDKRTGKRKSIEQEALRRDDEYKEQEDDDPSLEEMHGGQGYQGIEDDEDEDTEN
jgi:hypothetical protein